MSTRFFAVLFFAAAAGLIISGCEKKYEDGPAISLRSKKARVENTWEVEKAYDENGENITSEYDRYELRLTKDGDAELRAEYFGATFDTEGTWEFRSNKNNIYMDFENDDADGNYEILRLKEDEFWLQKNDGSEEIRLTPM